jgi:acyl-CoA synthetase (AMP-forming)/AMP-acid ligase II
MSEHETLLSALRQHAAEDAPGRLQLGSETLGYRELWVRIVRMSRRLRELGLSPGDRAAISMSNTCETVIMSYAVMHAGGVVLPLYYRPGLRTGGKDYARIVSILQASRARYLFTHESASAFHQQATTEAGAFTQLLTLELEAAATHDADDEPLRTSEDRLAIIQFSAGSTAEPKGICLRHEQLVANARGFSRGIEWTAADRVYSWLPLFHDMGLVGSVFTSLYVGASLTMGSPQSFIINPLGWLKQMSEQQSTITLAPQFAFDLALAKARLSPADCEALDLSALRTCVNGAEIVDPDACDEFEHFFAGRGLRRYAIQPGYGLAENCVAVAVRRPESARLVRYFGRAALREGRADVHAEHTPDTVARAGNGTPIDGTSVVVLDDEGNELGEGRVGELAISGGSSAARTLRSDMQLHDLPDPLRTGDLGLFHDGELFIVGRVKEMVKRGGEAFSPSDVENCVKLQMPDFVLTAAFGYHDAESGSEEVVLVGEARCYQQPERVAELVARARVLVLREFRLPLRDVMVVPPRTVPRTTSGKIRRLALRDSYLRGELAAELALRSKRTTQAAVEQPG